MVENHHGEESCFSLKIITFSFNCFKNLGIRDLFHVFKWANAKRKLTS